MSLAIEILSWMFVLAGSFFMIVSAVGIIRFPDFWARLHAASVGDSGGMILLIAGMCLQSGLTLITVKLVAIGLFLFITGPTATHAVANAALVTGWRPKSGKGLKVEENAPYADADPSVRGK
ncbi:MAG: monovalent cation/H(+) antiporter subunit G [Amylibacter sp.]|nr:monovalent cation/H(+) antiporter subunit G [Amylibacter sp.]MDG1998291.1 monovalent cation/H(+) antiporter subunit G [Amylibacter sp.]|tara:strand:- start:353 stop:718 length:366 start_codon:yes stop_codon:yes gene_type:complete